MNEIVPTAQWLLDVTPLLTAQLLLILLIRGKVRRRLGARFAYWLWLFPSAWLVATPLLKGISQTLFEAPLSIQALRLPPVSDLVTSSIVIEPIVTTTTVPGAIWLFIASIWMIGFSIGLIALIVGTARFQEQFNLEGVRCKSNEIRELALRAGFPETLPLVTLGNKRSPALYGVLEHCLLLPEDFLRLFDQEQREAILAHEYVHYSRKDNVVNFSIQLLCIVFWFNPIVHLAFRRLRFDQELSCDSQVLRHSTHKQRCLYAEALLVATCGHKYNLPGVSSWSVKQRLKERTSIISNDHRILASRKAKASFLLALLALGTLGSSVIGSQASPAKHLLEAEIIPPALLEVVAEANRRFGPPLEVSSDRIPADSEYLVFVIDTSESMINSPNWNSMIRKLEDIAAQYESLVGVQVISDMGDYLLSQRSRQWIPYESNTLSEIQASLNTWHPLSNDSPMEGIKEAATHLISPGQKTSIYAIGDDLSLSISNRSLDEVIAEVEKIFVAGPDGISNVRIHTLMFPTFFVRGTSQENLNGAFNYLSLMRSVSRQSGGTFELYGYGAY